MWVEIGKISGPKLLGKVGGLGLDIPKVLFGTWLKHPRAISRYQTSFEVYKPTMLY
jgi:hypothetical protein